MDTNVYFIHQVKHNKTTGVWDKGIVVKSDANTNNREAALQTYHAYLGAYAYSHDPNTDYVYCAVTTAEYGMEIVKECWKEGEESNT